MLELQLKDPQLVKWKTLLGEFVERYMEAIHACNSEENAIATEMSYLESVLKNVCGFLSLRESDYWAEFGEELFTMISHQLDFIGLQRNLIGENKVSRWADMGADIKEYIDRAVEDIDQLEFDAEWSSDNPAELTHIDLFGANDRF
jgi:hypothetical protein